MQAPAHGELRKRIAIVVMMCGISLWARPGTAQGPCPNKPTAPCTCVCPCDYESVVDPGFPSRVNVTTAGYWRVITSNGVPDHPIGIFPLDCGSDAANRCCGRPNSLMEQDYTFIMPAYSSEGSQWDESEVKGLPWPPYIGKPHATFGVAVNGVPFDPMADEWWDRTRPEAPEWALNPLRHSDMATDLDASNGHVQPDGAYHYHGFPYALYDSLYAQQERHADPIVVARSQIVLLGWAFDGNPISGEQCGMENSDPVEPKSSYVLLTDSRGADGPSSDFPPGYFIDDFEYDASLFDTGDYLDECNGHTGKTPDFPDEVYHYHILEKTDSLSDIGFPYIGRCYRLFMYGTGPNVFPKE